MIWFKIYKHTLKVWDTAGQERFRTITQAYYRSAHAVICAFDLTREQTFDSLAHWIEDVSKYCSPDVVKLLVGKCDCKEMSHEALVVAL